MKLLSFVCVKLWHLDINTANKVSQLNMLFIQCTHLANKANNNVMFK